MEAYSEPTRQALVAELRALPLIQSEIKRRKQQRINAYQTPTR